jgi:hypothetical protein
MDGAMGLLMDGWIAVQRIMQLATVLYTIFT